MALSIKFSHVATKSPDSLGIDPLSSSHVSCRAEPSVTLTGGGAGCFHTSQGLGSRREVTSVLATSKTLRTMMDEVL